MPDGASPEGGSPEGALPMLAEDPLRELLDELLECWFEPLDGPPPIPPPPAPMSALKLFDGV